MKFLRPFILQIMIQSGKIKNYTGIHHFEFFCSRFLRSDDRSLGILQKSVCYSLSYFYTSLPGIILNDKLQYFFFHPRLTYICFLCKNNKKIAIVIRHLLVIFEDLTWNVVICVFSESVMNGHYFTIFYDQTKKKVSYIFKSMFFSEKKIPVYVF